MKLTDTTIFVSPCKMSSMPGFEPGIFWSVVRRVIHCATSPYWWSLKSPANVCDMANMEASKIERNMFKKMHLTRCKILILRKWRRSNKDRAGLKERGSKPPIIPPLVQNGKPHGSKWVGFKYWSTVYGANPSALFCFDRVFDPYRLFLVMYGWPN